MPLSSTTFSERLQLVLKHNQLTQKKLAALTGMDQKSISRLKKGYNEPSESSILKIARATGGDGAVNYDDAPEAMTFDRDFLISQIGVERFKGLHIIHAVGDSMAPGISPGDLLFVNPAEREIRPGAVYVVQIENKTLVKRLDEDPIKKEVVLKSDNKDYQPLVVTGDDLDRLRVIGRVIGNFRKI